MNDQAVAWRTIQTVTYSENRGDYVRTVAFSSNEAELYLAAKGDSGKVTLWKQAEDVWVSHCTIDAHSDWVRNVVFTPDGGRIVSAPDDFTLWIWDLEAQGFVGEAIKTPFVHSRMRFEKGRENSGYIMTSTGAQSIDPSTEASLPEWCPNGYLELDGTEGLGCWITRYGKKTIFLPKPLWPREKYFTGNKVVIARNTGSLIVFQFSGSEPSFVT
jgi:WD40 repeat protein